MCTPPLSLFQYAVHINNLSVLHGGTLITRVQQGVEEGVQQTDP